MHIKRHQTTQAPELAFQFPTNSASVPSLYKIIKFSKRILTYCCKAVLHTAINAAIKPLALTLTSVTVQTATPRRTTVMLSFVSLEYRTWSRTTSRKQDTGIILSFAIWKEMLKIKTCHLLFVKNTAHKTKIYSVLHQN